MCERDHGPDDAAVSSAGEVASISIAATTLLTGVAQRDAPSYIVYPYIKSSIYRLGGTYSDNLRSLFSWHAGAVLRRRRARAHLPTTAAPSRSAVAA